MISIPLNAHIQQHMDHKQIINTVLETKEPAVHVHVVYTCRIINISMMRKSEKYVAELKFYFSIHDSNYTTNTKNTATFLHY